MTAPYYVPPEQMMKDRAEFARKGIARGRSIVAVEYVDGIVIVAENPSGSLQKIGELYDRIAFAGVGKYNEFEALRVAGIRHADLKGYAYAREDVTAKGLANAYAQTLGHIFTQEIKPYEVEVMVAEAGRSANDNRIFRVTYDGTLYADQGVSAIGGRDEQLRSRLEASFGPGAPLATALGWARAAFEEEGADPIPPEAWEAAVIDRTLGRRGFRRLTVGEIAPRTS
ncbi:MAG: proteasome subunit alpha [Actinobacteria bacterium]|nr:proteasome subunit alpha [Actinomycetota bacterium]